MKNFINLFLLSFFLFFGKTSFAQITEKLQNELDNTDNDFYRIRIEFNDNVDCFWYNQQFKDKGFSLKQRQKTIIRLLQQQANESQLSILENLRTNFKHEYQNLNQFWIINILVLDASEKLINELKKENSIYQIDLENNTFLPSLPIQPGTEPNQKSVGGTESGLVAINAPAMWNLGYTGRGRLVYNYDTGVWPNHPAFTHRFIANFFPLSQAWYGFFSQTPNGHVNDHGTHTLGTIAGLDTLTKDTVGVAFNAYWIANDFVTATVAELPPLTDMIGAFEWALNPDGDTSTTNDIPDVINNSWRWYDGADTIHCDGFIVNLMNAIEAAGIANVFAGGNFGPSNTTVNSPQRINTSEVNTFCVGSIDANQAYPYPISSFSSRGPTQCPGTGSLSIHPEVVAPGHNVRSAWGNDQYNTISGTSMATPHVSGAILLLKEAFPYLTGEDLLWALYLTAIDMGDPGEDNTYGNGLIDVYAAFQYLAASHTPVNPNQIKWDIAIKEVNLSGVDLYTCTDTYTPSISITNLGDSAITQANISYYFDENTPLSYVWNGNLLSGQTTTFNLPAIVSQTYGEQELTTIISTNKDTLEYDLINNRNVERFIRIKQYDLPFTENFENGFDLSKWYISNEDGSITWDTLSTAGLNWSNKSASIQFSNYSPRQNQHDDLISHEISIPLSGSTFLSFDLAYRKRSTSGILADTLRIQISTDCGSTFPYTIYEKAQDSLFTNDTIGTFFIPAYVSDWKRETLGLTPFGGNNIMVKFQGANRQGNNLYIDNINIYQGEDYTLISKLSTFDFKLYPNPAHDKINLVLPNTVGEKYEITIYNILGELLFSGTSLGNTSISTSNWDSGLYFIRISQGVLRSTKRFAVK